MPNSWAGERNRQGWKKERINKRRTGREEKTEKDEQKTPGAGHPVTQPVTE